jgi:hypothetical protein
MSEVEKHVQAAFLLLLLRLLNNLKMTYSNVCYFTPAMGKLCTNAQPTTDEERFRVAAKNLPPSALPITAI